MDGNTKADISRRKLPFIKFFTYSLRIYPTTCNIRRFRNAGGAGICQDKSVSTNIYVFIRIIVSSYMESVCAESGCPGVLFHTWRGVLWWKWGGGGGRPGVTISVAGGAKITACENTYKKGRKINRVLTYHFQLKKQTGSSPPRVARGGLRKHLITFELRGWECLLVRYAWTGLALFTYLTRRTYHRTPIIAHNKWKYQDCYFLINCTMPLIRISRILSALPFTTVQSQTILLLSEINQPNNWNFIFH